MRRPDAQWTVLLVLATLLWGLWPAGKTEAEPLWQSETARFSLSGHVKGFLISGRRLAEERFLDSRDRVALDADLELLRKFRLKVDYRIEAFGSILGPSNFAQAQQEARRDVVDLDWTLVDEPDFFARHRLHRAVLSADVSPIRVAVGRQRIAWGTGKLWSPTDLFNPLSPLSLERGERRGG